MNEKELTTEGNKRMWKETFTELIKYNHAQHNTGIQMSE